MTQELEPGELLDIQVLRMRPGDVLVVKADCVVSREMGVWLSNYLKARLPAGIQCLIVDKPLSLSLLRPPPAQRKARQRKRTPKLRVVGRE